MDWQSTSEVVCGLLIQGKQSPNPYRPDLFIAPFDAIVKEIKTNQWSNDDIIEKIGLGPFQTAVQAAEAVNGLGDKVDWYKALERAYTKHIIGGQLEKFARRLQRGDDVDLTKVVELAGQLNKNTSVMTPLSEVNPQEVSFIKTGWLPVDHHLGGIPEVGLITVFGAPGVGKTSFGIKLASKFAKTYPNKVVAVFTLEMLQEEFAKRCLEIDNTITHEEKSRILLCDQVLNVGEVSNRAATITDLGLVVVDFADQLVMGEMTESVMSEIYKTLAVLAKRLHIPVVLLAAMSRNYTGGVPRPAMIRYTSMAEYLSWMILALYAPDRDFAKDKDRTLPTVSGKAYICCWKSRGGFRVHKEGPGAIQLNWRGELAWSDKVGKWFTLTEGAENEDIDND